MNSGVSSDRTSRLNVIRGVADGIMARSHDILSRNRPGQHNAHYTVRLEAKFTSRRARLTSVTLYFVLVISAAVILAMYYSFLWRPNTNKLFHSMSYKTG
ncbi:hypothetical protein DPMN_090558 [Dreissena polymorpha]|uniref:Uncharacterized protein n=1 Tax=Dreissena polymorpha TaxID=45954 RepID=A0A9D4KYU9_DREPO|nr:hypothetical protein DPMN_090558 [Dreissena polymorpha]